MALFTAEIVFVKSAISAWCVACSDVRMLVISVMDVRASPRSAPSWVSAFVSAVTRPSAADFWPSQVSTWLFIPWTKAVLSACCPSLSFS